MGMERVMGMEPISGLREVNTLGTIGQASAIQVRDFAVCGALRGNLWQSWGTPRPTATATKAACFSAISNSRFGFPDLNPNA